MKSKMFSKFVDTHLVPGLPWGSVGKNLPANSGGVRDPGSIPLVLEDPLEEAMTTHSSIPA